MESAFSPRRVGADERCGNRLPLGPRLDCPATVKLRFALQLDGGFSELPLFGAEVKCRDHLRRQAHRPGRHRALDQRWHQIGHKGG